MARRLRLLLALLVLFAPAAFARVISYAPYTSRLAYPSYHLRTSRYFALAEGFPGESPLYHGQVVLYDSAGVHEPRVVYPGPTQSTGIFFVALWENPIQLAVPGFDPQPVMLVSAYQGNQYIFVFSADGGNSWTRINELDGRQVSSANVDFGGPQSRGLMSSVSIGTSGDADPFVIGANDGLYAISAAGKARKLAGTQSWNGLLGGDLAGTKFLARTSPTTLAMVTRDGTSTVVGELEGNATYAGWITSDGSIYLLATGYSGRTLYLYRNQQKEFIGGPFEVTPGAPGTYVDPMSFFAVPTSNYDGAWMIQRATGKPTTLSRHTIATGKETFWSDVTGPEVEALHTASAPDRLLIQVHRPRAQAERFFLDPALAVWHVGQPAPRTYDELFLNETASKGFVHLDVDTIASGGTFVFDSGTVSIGGGGGGCVNCSPGPGGGGDVVQEWGVVRGSLKQRLVLPGIARQAGAFGSYWLTDLVIHNPLDEPQTVEFRFVPIGEVTVAAIRTRTATLNAHEIRVMNDVVKTLFDVEQGGGALYIDPVVGVSVTARTYTRAGEGTYGFGMQAIDFYNAASPRFPVSFAGAFPGPEYRTNMLLTDTSGRGTETRLLAHGLSGTMGFADVKFSAPNNGVLQMNQLGSALGLTAIDSGGLIVQPTRGTAIASVVTMDNRTNDPTYFPPDLPAPTVRTIPAIGHLDGANGSKFRSDVYLLNRDPAPRTVTLEAKPWDSNVAVRIPFTLLPGEARVIKDALLKLFGMTGIARLRYSAGSVTGEGVRVTSRTYNVAEDGGTYGCLVPPFNSFQSAADGEQLEILGIVGGSGFRVNVGLVDLNPTFNGQNADADITIVDDAGKVIDAFSIKVPFAGGTQINDIFGARGLTPPKAAIIYIEVNHGLVGAYATLTDNVTNDSTFLGANLSASPN